MEQSFLAASSSFGSDPSMYNIQSPRVDMVLPQFSTATLPDTARIVPTRALSDGEKSSGFSAGVRPPLSHASSSSQRLGGRSSSAFVAISAGRQHNPSSAFSHIDSSIQFPSFVTNAQDCSIHSLDDNADGDDGFFLLSPERAQLDVDNTVVRQRRDFSSRALQFKESPRPRNDSTRTLRKPKIYLQPRPKRTSMFA